MARMNGNSRIVTIRKSELLARISENKEKHIKDYNEAVAAYHVEALRQLNEEKRALAKGSLNIRISLITPLDKREEYDKIAEIFKWEIKDEVELSLGEFNEYVLDDNDWAVASRAQNSMYKGK
jgi:hypothetical protein